MANISIVSGCLLLPLLPYLHVLLSYVIGLRPTSEMPWKVEGRVLANILERGQVPISSEAAQCQFFREVYFLQHQVGVEYLVTAINECGKG